MSTSQSAPPMTAGQLAQTTTRWLFKSEPDTRLEKGKDISFGIDKFEQLGVSSWDGVRNGQASGFMRDRMKVGHKALFYHSSCAVPGECRIGGADDSSLLIPHLCSPQVLLD